MTYPFRRARVLDAIGQSFGESKPLLNRRQQQYSGVRCHLAAVESDMHRLACDQWQTRQNPRTFIHGGRELRCLRLIGLSNQIIHETNGLCRSRQLLHIG